MRFKKVLKKIKKIQKKVESFMRVWSIVAPLIVTPLECTNIDFRFSFERRVEQTTADSFQQKTQTNIEFVLKIHTEKNVSS